MPASEQGIELLSTRDIEMFIPILREIDFGDQFLLSMLHWCGIGQRSAPLEYWEVFLLRSQENTVGVSGLYRQPGMPEDLCWLGWFAILPEFRRQGLGTAAIYSLVAHTESMNCKEIWVYTGSEDEMARKFYADLDFEVLGTATEYAPGKTTSPSDIILRRRLKQNVSAPTKLEQQVQKT